MRLNTENSQKFTFLYQNAIFLCQFSDILMFFNRDFPHIIIVFNINIFIINDENKQEENYNETYEIVIYIMC